MNIEAVGKGQRAARLQVRANFSLVDIRLFLVGNQHHGDIRVCHCLGDGFDGQAGGLCPGGGFAAFIQADDDIDAAFLQVQCVSVTLAAIADNGDLFILQYRPVRVFVIINFCHGDSLLCSPRLIA